MYTSIKLVLLAALAAPVLASAEIRTAESYHCTAFNAFTGYATIKWNKKTRKKGGAEIRYGWLTSQPRGGLLTYEPNSPLNFPRAILQTELNGATVPVHMDLLRPIEHRSKEVVLAGLTYIPLTVPASGFSTPYWTPYTGPIGHLSPLVPLPAGFVPTSVVTCRVSFHQ